MKMYIDFKKKKEILIVCIASVLLMMVSMVVNKENSDIADGKLLRPHADEESLEYDLDVKIDGERAFNKKLQINPMKYSNEETEKIFEIIYDRLIQDILFENTSLDDVRNNLNFKTEYEDYPVDIGWYPEDFSLIDSNGKVYNQGFSVEEIRKTTIRAVMTYEEYFAEYDFEVTVRNREIKNSEDLKDIVSYHMDEAENENSASEVQLPKSIDNKEISYSRHNDNMSPLIFIMLGGVGVITIIYGEYKKNQDKEKKRKDELERDYPELITKLTILTGSGMTVRKAWEQMVNDYLNNNKLRKKCLYEEMIISCNEMNSGISEELVYERFSKRCRIREYLKLGTLLQQNIRKGTKDICYMLRQESMEAFEERKNRARKKGEEAETKLLLPMILMLTMVLIIVMLPAVMAFQG